MRLPASYAVLTASLSSFAIVAAAASPAATAMPSSEAAHGAQAKAASGWVTKRLPTSVIRPFGLHGIAAGSTDLAWAVGAERVGLRERALLLHWDGRRWIKDALPHGLRADDMFQVSSASSRTAWALGFNSFGNASVLRWARGSWRRVPIPEPLEGQTVDAVAGGTGGGGWLAGDSGLVGSLLFHWFRGHWRAIKIPRALAGTVMDMHAVGRQDLWINQNSASGNGLIVHYVAGKWSSIAPPSGGVSFIGDVLAASSHSVWITGTLCTAFVGPFCTSSMPQLAHWNGTTWGVVLHPSSITGTTTISPAKTGRPLWAGVTATGASGVVSEPLFYEHFNGTTWILEQGSTLQLYATSTRTEVAPVPGTNATWAIANSQLSTPSPGVTVIQFNPGR
jgi:hypothetical protein